MDTQPIRNFQDCQTEVIQEKLKTMILYKNMEDALEVFHDCVDEFNENRQLTEKELLK